MSSPLHGNPGQMFQNVIRSEIEDLSWQAYFGRFNADTDFEAIDFNAYRIYRIIYTILVQFA